MGNAETNMISRLIVTALVIGAASAYVNEVWNQEQTEAAGLVHKGNSTISPLPHEYLATSQLPTNFSWCDHEGVNYCTKSLNQHIPQYCGSSGHTDLSLPSVTASRSLARARASTSTSPSNTCSTVAALAHATEAQLMAHTNGCTKSHSLVVASHTTPPTRTWPALPTPSKASVAVLIGPASQRTSHVPALPSLLPASVEPSTSTPTPPSPSTDPSPVPMPWQRKLWPADLSHAALMLALSSSTLAELPLWL